MSWGPQGWKEKIEDPFELDFEDDDDEDISDIEQKAIKERNKNQIKN